MTPEIAQHVGIDLQDYNLGNAIHYGTGRNDSPENILPLVDHLISETLSSEPLMIRTDHPHSVEYSGYQSRLALSIRFPVDVITSWQQAVELFSRHIK